MSQIATTSTPTRGGSRSALWHLGRALVVLVAVVATAFTGSGAASATAHTSSWSPYFNVNYWNWYGCTLYAGIAYDNLHTTYHMFGAGQVICPTTRSVAITVRQYRYPAGSSTFGEEVGTYGYSGYIRTTNVWVPTGPACRGGYTSPWFRTAINVTIDGYSSGWLYSTWRQVPAGQACAYS